MTLSLAACGGVESVPVVVSSAPAQGANGIFTAKQQALAQEFMTMAEPFDKTIDRVNASPEALADQELIKTMNELADEAALEDADSD